MLEVYVKVIALTDQVRYLRFTLRVKQAGGGPGGWSSSWQD